MKKWEITNNSIYPVNLHMGTGEPIHFKAGETIITTNESIFKACKGFAYTKQFIIKEIL